MAEHVDTQKRDFQFAMNADNLDLSLSRDKHTTTSKKRRQTIHGNEIRKENIDFDELSFNKTGRKNKIKAASNENASSVVESRTQEISIPILVRGTLRRRVSTCLLKHKLKKFQDYSLPYQQDNFALLRESSNVQAASKFGRSQKTPPPKPPRQKLPKISKSCQTMSPIADSSLMGKKCFHKFYSIVNDEINSCLYG